jgi:hypothetical protein
LIFIVSSFFWREGSLAVTLFFVERPLQPRKRPRIMLHWNRVLVEFSFLGRHVPLLSQNGPAS